jgi:hypothetical protein
MAVVIDGTNGVSSPDYEVDGVTGQLYPVVSGTAKAWNWNGLTTNKEIDFTGIPSWVKRITVMFSGVSTSGTSNLLIQLGDSGGIENTGYLGSSSQLAGATNSANYTTGFGVFLGNAANIVHGSVCVTNISGNVWAMSGVLGLSNAATTVNVTGTKTLSDTLTQVRITTVGSPATDTFDAGTINILYE